MRFSSLTSGIVLLACGTMGGCKGAEFIGRSPNLVAAKGGAATTVSKGSEQNPSPSPQTNAVPPGSPSIQLGIPCSGGASVGDRNVAIDKGGQVTVTGDICVPEIASTVAADIVFAVDVSGSMGTNDKKCQRREAVKAVVEKIKSSLRANDSVRFGFVKFESSSHVVSGLTDVGRAAELMNDNSLCDVRGNTNFENAFKDVYGILRDSGSRKKIVYFLSDGMPTQSDSGSDYKGSGLNAANRVHDLGNVSVYSIFLGASGQSDRSYLEKISRESKNVKVVADASNLISETLSFEIPKAVGLSAGDLQLSVNIPGEAATAVGIANLSPTGDAKIWKFTSQPFAPLAGAGNPTENVVTLKVRVPDAAELVVAESFVMNFK
jgi:Mg-chelatase subunit ChlD